VVGCPVVVVGSRSEGRQTWSYVLGVKEDA
jgi:hypothetical protein